MGCFAGMLFCSAVARARHVTTIGNPGHMWDPIMPSPPSKADLRDPIEESVRRLKGLDHRRFLANRVHESNRKY